MNIQFDNGALLGLSFDIKQTALVNKHLYLWRLAGEYQVGPVLLCEQRVLLQERDYHWWDT